MRQETGMEDRRGAEEHPKEVPEDVPEEVLEEAFKEEEEELEEPPEEVPTDVSEEEQEEEEVLEALADEVPNASPRTRGAMEKEKVKEEQDSRAQYVPIRILGHGAFGMAQLASRSGAVKSSSASELCVIKQVKLQSMSASERESALKEVQLLGQIMHPHVVKYIDSFVDLHALHIVMEYADGGDLAAALKVREEQRKCYEESEALPILAQCLLALQHLHKCHIMHRDVKPANIFVMSSGVIKIGDLGISKVIECTEVGTTTGTPSYIAPEICENFAYGFKVDIWSLGIVFYQLLTLSLPFARKNVASMVLAIVSSEPQPLPLTCSAEVCNVVKLALQKKARDRPSAQELLQVPVVHIVASKLSSFSGGDVAAVAGQVWGGATASHRSAEEQQELELQDAAAHDRVVQKLALQQANGRSMQSLKAAPQQTPDGRSWSARYWGLSKAQIHDFFLECLAHPDWSDEDCIRDFVPKFVKARTGGSGMGLALFLNQDSPKQVNVMTSHCWEENAQRFFQDLHKHLNQDDIPFICFLSLYQGSSEEIKCQLGGNIRLGPFADVISRARRLLVIPNEELRENGQGLYSRMWCVWEMYNASIRGIRIDFTDRCSPLHLFGTGDFSSRNARCGDPAEDVNDDEIQIRRVIEEVVVRTPAQQIADMSTIFDCVDVGTFTALISAPLAMAAKHCMGDAAASDSRDAYERLDRIIENASRAGVAANHVISKQRARSLDTQKG